MAAPGSDEADPGKSRCRHVVGIAKTQNVIGSLTLIQPDAADFHTRLEGVTSVGPYQVFDNPVRRADFDIGCVVVEPYEIACADRKRECACLWIVKWCTIHIKLRFVEEIWSEGVLEREKVVCWVVDSLEFVARQTAAIGRIDQADVPLSSTVKKRLLVDFVIDADQPRVFMDCCRSWGRDQVDVVAVARARQASLPLKGGVRIDEARRTPVDRAHRSTPRESLHDLAHLRGSS